jgi:hypothetical protein
MTERVTYFHFVAHSRRAEFEALGWMLDVDLGPPHDSYSSLYRFAGEGEPTTPDEAGKFDEAAE